MKQSPKLTLDNNCVINLFDTNSMTATSVEALTEIFQLALSGDAEIAITTRVEADLENDKDAVRKADFLKIIQVFPIVGTVPPQGNPKSDGGDVEIKEDFQRLADDIQKIVFPGGLNEESSNYGNKLNDIDHLVGHIINERDIFVTDDRAILRKSSELKRSPGIVVMSPAECLNFLNNLIESAKKVPLRSQKTAAGYSSNNLQGQVTFDYTNNDGRFVVGEGLFLFETKWSSASKISVHAYSDAQGIDCIAIAKGATAIDQVDDVSALDFTSRARTVNVGEVLILKNINGFYAAIRVLDVKVEKQGDEFDELTFEYAIQIDGTPSFIGYSF